MYMSVRQTGPHHQAMFEYVCRTRGETVRGYARSKKEAKQEAARQMLLLLGSAGESVPPEYGPGAAAPPPPPCRSYVALLKELCEEYKVRVASSLGMRFTAGSTLKTQKISRLFHRKMYVEKKKGTADFFRVQYRAES